MLHKGDVVNWNEERYDPHEVLRVNELSALVRPLARVARNFETLDGRTVGFDAPARAFHISSSEVGMLSIIRDGEERKR
jgi:hypothetical protein